MKRTDTEKSKKSKQTIFLLYFGLLSVKKYKQSKEKSVQHVSNQDYLCEAEVVGCVGQCQEAKQCESLEGFLKIKCRGDGQLTCQGREGRLERGMISTAATFRPY